MSTGLKLRPSCPGMGQRIELCIHISELADLLVQCRKGRYSLKMYQSAHTQMVKLCAKLIEHSERMPLA